MVLEKMNWFKKICSDVVVVYHHNKFKTPLYYNINKEANAVALTLSLHK